MPQNIFIYVIIALVVALAGLATDRYFLTKKNEKLNDEVGQYKAAVQSLKGDLNAKDEEIAKQNKAFDELVAQAEERAKKVREAQAKAREEAKKNESLSQELLLARRKTADACTDARNLVIDYLKGAQ